MYICTRVDTLKLPLVALIIATTESTPENGSL